MHCLGAVFHVTDICNSTLHSLFLRLRLREVFDARKDALVKTNDLILLLLQLVDVLGQDHLVLFEQLPQLLVLSSHSLVLARKRCHVVVAAPIRLRAYGYPIRADRGHTVGSRLLVGIFLHVDLLLKSELREDGLCLECLENVG